MALQTIENAKKCFEDVVQHNKSYKHANPLPMIHGYIAYRMMDETVAKEQFKINQEDCYSKLFLMAHDYLTATDKSRTSDNQFLSYFC